MRGVLCVQELARALLGPASRAVRERGRAGLIARAVHAVRDSLAR